jgi:hypothetical protein
MAKEHGISTEKAHEYTSENIGKKKYSRLKETIKGKK